MDELTPAERQTLIAVLHAEHARRLDAQLRGELAGDRASEIVRIAHKLGLAD